MGFVAMTRTIALFFGILVLIVERSRNKVHLGGEAVSSWYATLLSTEAITGKAPELVKATCPRVG